MCGETETQRIGTFVTIFVPCFVLEDGIFWFETSKILRYVRRQRKGMKKKVGGKHVSKQVFYCLVHQKVEEERKRRGGAHINPMFSYLERNRWMEIKSPSNYIFACTKKNYIFAPKLILFIYFILFYFISFSFNINLFLF